MSLYLAVFGKPRYLGLVDIENDAVETHGLSAGRWIVAETLRGVEMALLGGTLSQEQEGKYRSACLDENSDEHTKGPEPMLQEIRLIGPAGDAQILERDTRRKDEEAVLVRARQILQGHDFQMKLVDVEYTMDRKKLFFYFTSEQRVDFRAYVRDLAKEFRIRIEMRQIGVRDEAKTVRGVSPCGRPCCCSCWLHRFTPINIRMVKEQNLALNPTKISGICGRLMCCMFYEHSTYSELWKSLPSPGSKIKAPQGSYIMSGVDLRAEAVRVALPEGGEAVIPVAEFAEFKETILRGEPWKKEEENDADKQERKPSLPRGVTAGRSPLSRIGRAVREKPSDGSAAAGRKAKPEKMSIEEHIAEREHAEIMSADRPGHFSRPAGTDVKKTQRRYKDAPPAARKPEGREAQGQRPGRALPGSAPEGVRKDGQDKPQPQNYQNRRRPRPYKDGRQGPGMAGGAPAREDS